MFKTLIVPFFDQSFEEIHVFGRTFQFIASSIERRKRNNQNFFHFMTYRINGTLCGSVRFLLWQINFEKFTKHQRNVR